MSLWLVTGGTGFIGGEVLRAIAAGAGGGCDVVTVGRRCPAGWDRRAFLSADLTDPAAVEKAVQLARPSVVIHAAGRTPPGTAGEFDRENVRATIHLLDALRRERRPARVVLLGSAAELGPSAPADRPVGEDEPWRPADAYGWSKLLATGAGLLASRPPLEVVVARVFNPFGPGTPASNVFGSFARRLLDPNPGPLLVGDIDARRDFIDVRDVAHALIALAERGTPGRVYHVGTGVSHRVGDGLARLIGLSRRSVDVRPDPALLGDARGPRDSRADITRVVAETGWRPSISWEQSLDDLWRHADDAARRSLALTA